MSRKNMDTREKILDATWKLLESEGAASVRMSDIAKRTGVSRQAVYLHFPTRGDLLVATARYLDEVKDVDGRLAESRAATTGVERLKSFIKAWGDYIPEVHGVCKALLAMEDTDEAARAAWLDRMGAVRHGCEAAVRALKEDGRLAEGYTLKTATDFLWTLLSVHNWEQLTEACGWSQKRYLETMQNVASEALVD